MILDLWTHRLRLAIQRAIRSPDSISKFEYAKILSNQHLEWVLCGQDGGVIAHLSVHFPLGGLTRIIDRVSHGGEAD